MDSPCVNDCRLDQTDGRCVACGRTLAEITSWSQMTELERQRALSARPKKIGLTTVPVGPIKKQGKPRIVSLLPAATEMVCALGLAEHLVGISHECDYPPEIGFRPTVVRSAIPLEGLSQREIDDAITERLRVGGSLYEMDGQLLRELAPDLILTQDLCQVCAPAGNEITQLLKSLPTKPQILWMTPKLLDGIFENIRDLGEATGRRSEAGRLIAEGRARIERVAGIAKKSASHPRVFCMEWLDPIYCAGHWMPEIVELAGGVDRLARRGTPSVRIAWDEVLDWVPEVLIVTPCGFHLGKVVELSEQLAILPKWAELPAVRLGRVYAVDADSYFARPGPRIVAGAELLAHLIHPELFGWDGPAEAYCRLKTKT